MNAQRIKAVLAVVHLIEANSTNRNGLTRPSAIEQALATVPFRLTREEAEVLCRSCNVEPSEVTWGVSF